jgi:hypothetical protein
MIMIRFRRVIAACTIFVATAALGQVAGSPNSQEQTGRLFAQLQDEHAAATARFAADDPRVVELDRQIATLRQKIAAFQAANGMPASGARPVLEAGGAEVPAKGDVLPPPEPSLPVVSPRDQAARQALETSTTFKMEKVTLQTFIDQLQEQTHAVIWVNWQALHSEGVDHETLVTINLAGVQASQALKIVLNTVGAANLGSTIDDGIVTITTRDDLNSTKYQELRVYNVRDLLTVDVSAYPLETGMAIQQQRIDSLISLVESAVAPDSWRDMGGMVGSIREFDGLLVITQTHDNFLEVESLLAKIRAAH